MAQRTPQPNCATFDPRSEPRPLPKLAHCLCAGVHKTFDPRKMAKKRPLTHAFVNNSGFFGGGSTEADDF